MKIDIRTGAWAEHQAAAQAIRYAVFVIDDENGNGKLDTNFIGIPTEGFGFSNNLHLTRKPTFEEAGFKVGDQDSSIVIQLDRY